MAGLVVIDMSPEVNTVKCAEIVVFSTISAKEALIELASLREPVDEFFENVMVNAEDREVRINRLTLLSKLRDLFLQVADISLLQ